MDSVCMTAVCPREYPDLGDMWSWFANKNTYGK
jgi:hypothetical protein